MAASLRSLIASAVLLATLAACASDGPGEAEMLASVTDNVIVPRYEALASETAALRGALATACASPSDATLTAARDAWRRAVAAWAQSEASGVGPAQDRRSASRIAWPIVQPERIDALIADRPNLTADAAGSEISSTQRGLWAIEHVLFTADAPAGLASGSGRCAYLAAVAQVAADEASALLNEWRVAKDGGGPPYKDYFTARSAQGLITSDAVAELVRTQVFLIRTIVDMRLAGAVGLRGEPDPSAIPGGAAENALADLRNQIEGMRAVYEGADGESAPDGYGLAALVAPRSADADSRVRERFAASSAAMDALGAPLRQAAARRSPEAQALLQALMDLQTTLSTEVVSLLGVSVGFSDADGDSLR